MEIENNLEGQPQQTYKGNLNEWGEYVGNQDNISIFSPGVIEAIQNNDPAIKSVFVSVNDDEDPDMVDWHAAGQCLGNSKYVTHLSLTIEPNDVWSADDKRDFCRGLNQNRSIEASEICFIDITSTEIELLLPFFANNTKLVFIDMNIFDFSDEVFCPRRFHDSIGNALRACQSVKSIRICSDIFAANYAAIQAICEMKGLLHLSFGDYYFSEQCCQHIGQTLCDVNCQIKSLALGQGVWRRSNANDLMIIANGLAQNKSVEFIKIKAWPYLHDQQEVYDKVEAFVLSIRKVTFNALEKFCFHSRLYTCLSFSVIRGMTMLNSMMCLVESKNLVTLEWKILVSNIISSNSVEKLSFESYYTMAETIENDQTLHDFAGWVASNSTLKRLYVNSSQFTTAALCTILRSLQTSMLEEISIMVRESNQMMTALSQFMASNQQVRVFKIRNEIDRNNFEGWHEMLNVLQSHRSIEEIDIVSYIIALPENVVADVANILRTNSIVKRLRLQVVGTAKLQVIADAIADPNCSLEELEVHYERSKMYREMTDAVVAEEREELTQILVNALHRNASLKVFKIHYQLPGFNFKFDGSSSSFTNLLCNVSSINATYHSNHVLESINLHDDVPINIYSLLHSNQNTDKLAVARKKILQSHSLENVEFAATSLPNVFSSIGNTDSKLSLSQLYGILRRVPHIIPKNKMKRKLNEL
eukprot:scaffold94953_cov58-Cyclotella_meneghiniana.AAC.2